MLSMRPENQFAVPAFDSFFHLQERLWQWSCLQGVLLPWISRHALYRRSIKTITTTRFVHMTVEPRWEHSAVTRRVFKVRDIETVPRKDVKPLLLLDKDFGQHLQNFSEIKVPQGSIKVLFVISCLPLNRVVLGIVLTPDYLQKVSRVKSWKWKAKKDIEEGSPSQVDGTVSVCRLEGADLYEMYCLAGLGESSFAVPASRH